MGTEFKPASTINANLMNLPLMQHFNENQIVTKVDNFRKGEKNLFWFLKLGAMAGIGYALWVYVLPVIFLAIGKMLAIAATLVMVVGLIICAPAIFKGLRLLARQLHKAVIKYDPFGQLAETRVKMIAQQSTFRVAKSNLSQLKNDMDLQAKTSLSEAEAGRKESLRLRGKSENLKAEMEKMIVDKGLIAKEDDTYVDLGAELHKTLAKATQVLQKSKQNEDFTEKYAIRANILKKLGHKLTMVETAMDIKISDFDTTVEMLKKDYEFGQKANAATSAAKSVLGFSADWERDYALECITSTISADIASTSGNLKDIESLTSNYDLDSDALFDNLNAAADKFESGEDALPNIKKYNNPDYKLTSEDKMNSRGLGEMF